MLTIDFAKEHLSDVYIGIGGDRAGFTTDPYTYGFLIREADPFLSMMASTQFSLPAPSHTVWKVFGLSGADFVEQRRFASKPNTVKPRSAGDYDRSTYGSILAGIVGGLGVASGNPPAPSIPASNWTFTRHGSFQGRARPKYATFFDEVLPLTWGSISANVRHASGGLSFSATFDGSDPTLVRTPGFCPYDMSDLLPLIASQGITFVYVNGFGRYDGTLSGFSHAYNPHVGYTFDYHLNWLYQGSVNVDLDVHVAIPLPSQIDSRSTSSLLFSLSLPAGQATLSWSGGHNTPSPNGSDPSGSVSLGPMNFVIASASTSSIPDEQLAYQAVSKLDSQHWLGRFISSVERYHTDITYASYLSTSSAMGALTDTVFAAPAKSLQAALYVSKQISLASIMEFPPDVLDLPFGDFKTFAQKIPFVSPLLSGRALQLVHDLQRFRDSLDEFDKVKSYRVHGSYHYDFPANSFGRETSSLTCKTVLDVSASTRLLSTALLSAEAASFLASAATRFAQLPILTLVRGMVGMTAEFDAMFRALAGLTLPIVYCHTFLIQSPLTSDELDYLGISSSDGKPISMTWFFRDISLYSPLPRQGHFNFGPSVDPLGSAASFAIRSLLLRILG